MSIRSPLVCALSVATAALSWTACGTDKGPEATCETDRDQIVVLLASGLPTYDYEPAADLAALVASSDLVLSGTIGSVVRVIGEPNPDGLENSWTRVSIASSEVLHAAAGVEAIPGVFAYSSAWPGGAGPDPLGEEVAIEGLSFLAFLDRWESAPGGYVTNVQGLVVDCVDGTTPSPVIQPLPGDATAASLPELATLVVAAGAASGDPSESGVDGPLITHLAPEDTGGEDALILGTLELEGGCLYLRQAERYPVVWPHRTRWDSTREVVVLPSGEEVGLSESVSGGGGYHYLESVERTAGPDAAALVDHCLDNTYGEVAIFNNWDDGVQPG